MARLERESQEHGDILAALDSRDAQQAEEKTRHHIWNLFEELAQVLGIPKEVIKPLPMMIGGHDG